MFHVCNLTEMAPPAAVSRYNEDVSYLTNLGIGNYIVYDVDADNYNASERDDPYHGIPNRGKEAMAYLTYAAQYYDCLPKVRLHYLTLHPFLGRFQPFSVCKRCVEALRCA